MAKTHVSSVDITESHKSKILSEESEAKKNRKNKEKKLQQKKNHRS